MSVVKACSTSCFEEGRLSMEERTDLSLKPWTVFGTAIIRTGTSTQDRQGVGI